MYTVILCTVQVVFINKQRIKRSVIIKSLKVVFINKQIIKRSLIIKLLMDYDFGIFGSITFRSIIFK